MSDQRKAEPRVTKAPFDILSMPAIPLEAIERSILERARRRGLIETADQADIDILQQASEQRRTRQDLDVTSSDQAEDV